MVQDSLSARLSDHISKKGNFHGEKSMPRPENKEKRARPVGTRALRADSSRLYSLLAEKPSDDLVSVDGSSISANVDILIGVAGFNEMVSVFGSVMKLDRAVEASVASSMSIPEPDAIMGAMASRPAV